MLASARLGWSPRLDVAKHARLGTAIGVPPLVQAVRPGPSAEMIAAILAGGQGTRLAEETRVKSKAMVRIGDRPILWHLLKYYEQFGFREFVVALGYQADSIRQYFAQLGGGGRRRSRGVHGGLSARRAGLDGRAGRHRARHHVGRADQAPGALSRRRAVHAHLVRRPRRRRARPAARVPRAPWPARRR